MTILPWSATALPLLFERVCKKFTGLDAAVTSGSSSNVTDDGTHSTSTAGSDDTQADDSKTSEQSDEDEWPLDIRNDNFNAESDTHVNIGAILESAPWRCKLSVNQVKEEMPEEHLENQCTDREMVAHCDTADALVEFSDCAETAAEMLLISKIRSLQRRPADNQDQISSACSTGTADDDGRDRVLTPCSTHSMHDDEELLAEPERAVVLRWDHKAARWVPDEIEIHEPPPLRRFAMPFGSHTEGDNFYERVQLCARHNNYGREVSNSGVVGRVSDFNLDAPVFLPECNGLEADVQVEYFSLPNGDLGSNDLVLTSAHKTIMSTFRLDAPEFVPHWTEGESAASFYRTRLNSSAEVFVPSLPFPLL